MLVCTIELMNGKAVQLRQGLEKVVERDDVLSLAKYYSRFGELCVIDIDAAVGNGNNEELISQICKLAQCRVGGGIKTVEKAQRILSFGARRIIIGTAASETFLAQLPKDKIIVAVDSKNGVVAVNAWTRTVSATPVDYIKRFNNYCSGFLYTNVEKAGMLDGIDFDVIKNLKSFTPNELTVAGGISTLEEIYELQKMNISPQLGMGIYTGKISLPDAFVKCIDFEKRFGYIPTIVQDSDTNQVLSLCYSNKESLLQALNTAKGTYFNREEKKIITKGEASGNIQELVSARYNCDMDAILFKVKQKGNTCHLGRYSCFETKDNSVCHLFNKIIENKRLMPDKSETTKLFNNEFELKKKIMEKAFDTVNFEKGDDFSSEASDLLYYTLIFMAMNNLTPADVINSLSSKEF